MTFSHLPQPLAEALAARGYEELTPVQAAVIEPEARGRDLVVSAQTGSGKTVAFGLAIAEQLLDEDLAHARAPLALIIAPTRELAQQVSRELEWLYASTNARIVTCVGGMDPIRERRALEQGAAIVVGTPGRLRDHLERGKLQLGSLRAVVLDEADEMLDMGFREDLEEMLDATPTEQRRTLLFSATMPRAIEALAQRYQRDSLRIQTAGTTRGHGDIAYEVVTVAPSDIEHAVVNLLRFHEADTAILFCATRDNVKHLHATLVERGFSAVALSGEHSQNERNNALQALRDRRARVCVATDVAARGLDLPSLSLVVHVEIPRDAETLQHRSGRTGRAGKKGRAVLVVPYPRRRRVEMMLRSARIEAEWNEAPTPESIRDRDRERMMEGLLAPVEADEEDRAIARVLLEKVSAEDLAAALVRAHRSALPSPEEMLGNGPEAREKRERPGFDTAVWFRMDVGRDQRAEPRWILPVLCRRGHVTREAVGQIRITGDQTWFQIPAEHAEQFAASVARTARDDGEYESTIRIERAPDSPREVARHRGRDRDREGPQGRGRRPHAPGAPAQGGGYQGASGQGPSGEQREHKPRPAGKPFHKKPKKY